MFLNNIKIGIRLFLGFGTILILFFIAAGITIILLQNVVQDSEKVEKESLPFTLTADEMVLNIQQVQQWLTYVSATQDPAGYKDAASAAKSYKQGSKLFMNMFKKENDKKAQQKMNELNIVFDKFYWTGLDMAEAYIIEGRNAGNVIMKRFGKDGKTLSGKIEDLRKTQTDEVNTMMKSIVKAAGNVQLILLVLGGLAILIGAVIAYLTARSVTRPLSVGVNVANRLAEGDLTINVEVKSKDETGQLLSAMKNMVGKLRKNVNEMTEVSSTLAATSEEINASANSLADGAQNQAASVEETSASTEELTVSIKQVSDHTITMQEKSNHSLSEAQAFKITMNQVTEEMNTLGESTEKIGDIIKVINDIADQTNLLSLNAAIEAARAGEHGRGFSVVADAISTLATRSSESTKEIEKLISESITRINKGVTSVKSSSESFDAIIVTIEENNNIVNEITKSMEEQHQGSEHIQKATEEINQLTQGVSASAEEMASSTSELHDLAERLNTIVNTFKIDGQKGHKTTAITTS